MQSEFVSVSHLLLITEYHKKYPKADKITVRASLLKVPNWTIVKVMFMLGCIAVFDRIRLNFL